MGLNVDIKADATQAITNTSENVPKGFGKVWNMFCGKHEANVQRYKMLTAVQTQKERELILSGQADFVDGTLVQKAFEGNVTAQIIANEQQQEIDNLAGNTAIALEVLRDIPDEEISDEEVPPDFFSRWRNEAKMIGSKELQDIWGRILAEEVKKPNTISLRALDIIKNISRGEAELFCEVARYSIGGKYILKAYLDGKFCDESEAIDKLILLEECGILSNVGSSGFDLSPEKKKKGKLRLNGYIVSSLNDDSDFSTSILPLSSVGRALLAIVDVKDFPKDHLKILESRCFHKKGNPSQKVKVNVHRELNGLYTEPLEL